jgi:hypothetical protein
MVKGKQKELGMKVPVDKVYKVAEKYLKMKNERDFLSEKIGKQEELLIREMKEAKKLRIKVNDKAIVLEHISEKDKIKISNQ